MQLTKSLRNARSSEWKEPPHGVVQDFRVKRALEYGRNAEPQKGTARRNGKKKAKNRDSHCELHNAHYLSASPGPPAARSFGIRL